MNTGMLWLIDHPRDGLDVAVQAAAAYYKKKYGQSANMCHAHPTTIRPECGTCEDLSLYRLAVEEITVLAMQSVLPGHLFIGVEDAK